jgi:hypothetical protein
MIGVPEDCIKFLFNQDKDKFFEVKEHKQKRSLTANAYAWCLIGKIADAMRLPKEEIYLTMLKRYGQSEVVSVLSSIDVTGYFKYYEAVAETSLHGKKFTHYRVFKGSSEFDSREMAVLIDGIISEAEELGIETLPPCEVERLKEMWS